LPIITFNPGDLVKQLPVGMPVVAPVDEPVAKTSFKEFQGVGQTVVGVWESTPGVWRRQIVQAEFCVILEGRAVFAPDVGEPIALQGGDAVYFPADTTGVWHVEVTLRKTYLAFDQ
jgi:uncharacterized cupin superfamily protein